MKVGDMVVRAYAYRGGIIPGIIVEENIEVHSAGDLDYAYEECHFSIQWSDGTQSSELYEELDYIEDVLEMHHTYNKNRGDCSL